MRVKDKPLYRQCQQFTWARQNLQMGRFYVLAQCKTCNNKYDVENKRTHLFVSEFSIQIIAASTFSFGYHLYNMFFPVVNSAHNNFHHHKNIEFSITFVMLAFVKKDCYRI